MPTSGSFAWNGSYALVHPEALIQRRNVLHHRPYLCVIEKHLGHGADGVTLDYLLVRQLDGLSQVFFVSLNPPTR